MDAWVRWACACFWCFLHADAGSGVETATAVGTTAYGPVLGAGLGSCVEAFHQFQTTCFGDGSRQTKTPPYSARYDLPVHGANVVGICRLSKPCGHALQNASKMCPDWALLEHVVPHQRILLADPAPQGHHQSMSAVADTYVRGCHGNIPGNSALALKTSANVCFTREALVKFPVPCSARAVLTLIVEVNQNNLGVRVVLTDDSWSESTQWSGKPATGLLLCDYQYVLAGKAMTCTIPASTFIGKNTVSFTLQATFKENGWKQFYSREAEDASNRPRLDFMCTTTTTTTCTTTTMTTTSGTSTMTTTFGATASNTALPPWLIPQELLLTTEVHTYFDQLTKHCPAERCIRIPKTQAEQKKVVLCGAKP